MTMFPTRALTLNAIAGRREFAADECIGAKKRRRSSAGQIDSELQILDDMTGSKFRFADAQPWKDHPSSHELAWQTQPMQSLGACLVFDYPCKFRGGPFRPGSLMCR